MTRINGSMPGISQSFARSICCSFAHSKRSMHHDTAMIIVEPPPPRTSVRRLFFCRSKSRSSVSSKRNLYIIAIHFHMYCIYVSRFSRGRAQHATKSSVVAWIFRYNFSCHLIVAIEKGFTKVDVLGVAEDRHAYWAWTPFAQGFLSILFQLSGFK